MNAPALLKIAIPSLEMAEEELIAVLESSIFPGARIESIKLVVGYCRAGQLDPLQKPVHIVPMNVKKAGTRDQYEWRDVVMPGVGLYRTQAARTGEHIGTDEPEFGPMVELTVGEYVMRHPEWCRVTVYRLKGSMKCAYTATEYWLENYATAGKDTLVPNAMWKKRPRGQIAKCAEAQALRKAFPEIGNQPTADEMAGKTLDEDEAGVMIDGATGQVEPTRQLVAQPRAKSEPSEHEQQPRTETQQPPADDRPMSESQLRILRKKMEHAALSDIDLVAKFGPVANLKFCQFNAIQEWIASPRDE